MKSCRKLLLVSLELFRFVCDHGMEEKKMIEFISTLQVIVLLRYQLYRPLWCSLHGRRHTQPQGQLGDRCTFMLYSNISARGVGWLTWTYLRSLLDCHHHCGVAQMTQYARQLEAWENCM
jgi:hypothetical protein